MRATEDVPVKVVPMWSDVFGSSKSPASNSDSTSPGKGEAATADQTNTIKLQSRQMMHEWIRLAED